jgi:S-DNA-T family DNA segregation ATPase FtsK/SpoIIIE
MRRYGFQPMMVMNSGDGLPEIAAVVLARWAWRYRSELAPLTTAAGMWLAAWVLHVMRPGWWLPIAATSAVLAAGVGSLGRFTGLATRAERWYAAITTAVTGGWLAAGVVLGPWRSPLPLVLLIALVVLGVPWWAHRRRRARVRVERTLAVWPDIAQAVGLAGSRVM